MDGKTYSTGEYSWTKQNDKGPNSSVEPTTEASILVLAALGLIGLAQACLVHKRR